ncbi:tellurite resistance protein B [Vibrio cincinnatiensis]|uniref:Uncharacterized protein n=1 Tax=Vibrio cincinnatiensis DSM 19608 TaxID=1123491 RepID=A0A1T4P1M9_VIBCI|nr:hypothetical protein SAMN02745782_01558 [Vibrio cincinnatiensis DSM 19608]SUP05640.1 tellurite resistance protein B [Vibrio cincinnatiensis]
MSHLRIPKNWTVQRSPLFFTKENVPQLCFLTTIQRKEYLVSCV